MKERKLRISTELEVYWDRLSVAVENPTPSFEEKEIEFDSTELRYRGFSVIEKPNKESPEVPVYERIMTTSQRWRDLEGYHTRFGKVDALLAKPDNRFVIMNAGDELILKFKALPPVKEGYKRDFVLVGDGWIKDGDLNSRFSRTVLPLPNRDDNDYSRRPTKLEDDPVYQKHREDWIDFHTRYVRPSGFVNRVRRSY